VLDDTELDSFREHVFTNSIYFMDAESFVDAACAMWLSIFNMYGKGEKG
jgi:hypothetical protein